MTKIRLLRNCVVNSTAHSAGDVVECSARDAEKLIDMRKAVPFTAIAATDEAAADNTGEKKTGKPRGKKSNATSDDTNSSSVEPTTMMH